MEPELEQIPERGQTHKVFAVIPRFNLGTLVNMIGAKRVASGLSSQKSISRPGVWFDGAGTDSHDSRKLVSSMPNRARQGAIILAVERDRCLVVQAGLPGEKEATTIPRHEAPFRV